MPSSTLCPRNSTSVFVNGAAEYLSEKLIQLLSSIEEKPYKVIEYRIIKFHIQNINMLMKTFQSINSFCLCQ